METTDYVSYQTALALKACGFDEPCDHYYCGNGSIAVREDPECFNCYKDLPICSCPTLWQTQKWLREVKGIDVEIRVCIVDGKKGYEAYVIPPYALTPAQRDYESALSAGIVTSLELIKKGE